MNSNNPNRWYSLLISGRKTQIIRRNNNVKRNNDPVYLCYCRSLHEASVGATRTSGIPLQKATRECEEIEGEEGVYVNHKTINFKEGAYTVAEIRSLVKADTSRRA